jgi:hypothetical protein
VDLGDEVAATWTLGYGVVTGDGTFTFQRTSATEFSVTGAGSVLADGDSCELDMTSLDMAGSSSTEFGVGTLVFSGRSTAGTITGTVTFDGSAGADVVARFQGEDRAWTFDLETGSILLEPQ